MRRNVLLFVVALILITVLFFLFLYRPLSNRIAETRDQIEAAENERDSLQLELERLEALRAQAPQLRERVVRLDAAMPTNDPQLAQFILLVQDAANVSGIEWLSVAPSPPAAGEQAGTMVVNITMSVDGGYFQVQDFLVRLENLPRAVKIGTISLSPKQIPELTAALTMRMFMTAPAAPAPAAPAAGTPAPPPPA